MKRKNFLLLFVFILGVGAILSLSVSDLSFLQPPQELIELSVIIRDSDSSTWSAARQGMDQAAGDLGVELRFLALTTANSTEEQRTLLHREVEVGTDGVILVPANPAALAEDVKLASQKTVIVTMESDMSSSGSTACISADNAELGKALANAALDGVPPGGTVLLLDSSPGSTGIQARINAAAEVLEQSGRLILRYSITDTTEMNWENPPQAVLTFEATVLEQMSLQLQGKSNAPLLYGMGATNTIAAGLEQGTIAAIAAQNEFTAGYLAVEEAVRAATGKPLIPMSTMKFFMLNRINMYQLENQKLLFPVTR
ncbi:MAG: substrate-binding domain-containing protein [Angelakisella sp.]|nr:substrate-binding domain-containing protein [Angelakisella sp.]